MRGVGDGDLAAPALLQKDRNYAAAAANYVAVTRATESRILRAGVCVGLYEHFFRAQLGGAVEIDGIDRFVGAQRHNPAHALINGRIDYVAPAHDVGLDRFKRVVLACGHLLKRCRMHYNGDSRQSAPQPIHVAHIANEIAQAGMIESRGSHLMLLQLVAAENDEPVAGGSRAA